MEFEAAQKDQAAEMNGKFATQRPKARAMTVNQNEITFDPPC